MRRRILIIPQVGGDSSLKYTEWHALQQFAEVATLQVPGDAYLLCAEEDGVELEHCLELARAHFAKYDYIVGECTGAFLWHAVFRLVGDKTPFIILPHFNHVSLIHAYAVLLSSQLALPQDIVFAGSTAASRSFAQFGFHCDPLFPLGIDLSTFRPLPANKTSLRISLDLGSRGDILLYVGRVEEDKNILELLDIFELVRQACSVELVVCYRFKNVGYLQRCMERVEAIGGIHFIEDPDIETLVQYYNAADLFVSAAVSVFETFGRAPVEAMACGLPPVVAEYDGFRETIPPECGILVSTTTVGYEKWPDVPRFAQAVITALADKAMLKNMSRHCIRNARRFEHKASLQAMLAKAGRSSLAQYPGTIPGGIQLSLQGYPSQIKALWSSLEGKDIRELLTDFLLTLEVPVQPSPASRQAFYESWFAHY